MTSINLYQAQTPKNEGVSKARYVDSGFIVSIGILVIVLVSLGGAKFYLAELDKQKNQLEEKIKQEQEAGLTGKMVDRAADFQQRLDFIKANSTSNNLNEIITNLSRYVVAGIIVDNFKYSKNAVSLTLRSDNYVALARQILAFKQQDKEYSSVSIENVRRADDKIVFDAELVLAIGK